MGTKLTVATQAQANQRAAMIAEAAYFAAERRNFEPGNEVSDWLVAEQQVDSIMHSEKSAGSTKPSKKKVTKVAAPKAAAKKAAAKKAPAKKASAKKAPAKKAAAKRK